MTTTDHGTAHPGPVPTTPLADSVRDAVTGSEPVQDHSAVHQFIRSHGRRPSFEELALSRERVALARAPRSWPVATPPGLAMSLRREVARLLSRL